MINRVLLFFALLVPLGCKGITGGDVSGRRHGFEVSKELSPGMSFDEVQAVLGDGGEAYRPKTFFRNAEGTFVAADPAEEQFLEVALREMEKLSEANRSNIHKVIVQARGWGFFGFDEFYLYFDEEDVLVAHAMHHFN